MLILKFISFGICVILKLCNRKNLKLFIIKIVIDRFEVFELKKFNKIYILELVDFDVSIINSIFLY